MEDRGWATFRRYWLGHVTSAIGDYFTLIAFPLAALELTHSALFAGVVEFAELATSIAFGVWIGGFADRAPTRAAIVASDVIRAAAIGTLAVTMWFGNTTPAMLLVTVCAMSMLRDLHDSAEGGLLAVIVPDAYVTKASAFLGRSDGIGHVTGALVGGLAASVGVWLAFGFDAATFVIAACASFSVGKISRHAAAPSADTAAASEATAETTEAELETTLSLRQTLHMLREENGYWRVIAASSIGNITSACFISQFVVLAERTLHLERWQTGATFACMGLGSILASFWCERHDTIQPKFMTLGDASIGAAALACGLAPHLGVVIAAFLVVGAAVTISMVTSRAIRIRRFPANAQGRLVMINRTALYSLLLPSILLAGWLADHVSSPALFIAYGLVGLGAAALGLALGVPNIDTHAVDNSIDHASDNSTHEAPAQVGDARVVDDPTTSRTIAATLGQSHLPPTNPQAKDP